MVLQVHSWAFLFSITTYLLSYPTEILALDCNQWIGSELEEDSFIMTLSRKSWDKEAERQQVSIDCAEVLAKFVVCC